MIIRINGHDFGEIDIVINKPVRLTDKQVDVLGKARKKEFMRAGWRESYASCALCFINKRKCKYDCPNPPFLDHGRGMAKSGERIFIHQPYIGPLIHMGSDEMQAEAQPIRRKHLAEIERQSREFADKHGLTVTVSETKSWHFPTETVLVLFKKQ
jgi:hypothetical protein